MQLALFGRDGIGVDASFAAMQHIALDATAWVEYLPSWVSGHQRHASSNRRVSHSKRQSVQGN